MPAYLSEISGLDLARIPAAAAPATTSTAGGAAVGLTGGGRVPGDPEVRGARRARRIGALTRDTALFVVGFGTVFVLLGLSASAVGRAVVHQQTLLTRISGVVVVAMALFLAGTVVLRTPGLYREWRLHPRVSRLEPLAAPVAGAAFAFGWTPCVGPILASVLALSAYQGRVGQGALLLAVYSLGLGAPFLVVAVLFDRLQAPLAWLRRHGSAVTVVSASLLGALGVLLLDRLAWITTLAQHVT
ncbi:MAG: sulfite exporter TauE/SafE family protein [Actinomycetota bacterium]|nr:sulfite exporter TauE/SafE family protein [Actinomycetota bacterium]